MYNQLYTQGEYLKNNPTWHSEDAKWKAQNVLKILKNNNIQINSICEVGCGAGEVLNQLYLQMSKDIVFTGYEVSPQAFELCKKLQKDRLNFSLKDIFLEENYFDLILCLDVFEHIEDYFTFLKKLKDKSKYQIFHIPLDISVSSVLRPSAILKARKSVGHLHYFTQETAFATLQDTGYKIIASFYTAGSIELAAKSFKTLLARIPRQISYKLNPDLTVRLLGGYSLMLLTENNQ